jgi:hypothetical protein
VGKSEGKRLLDRPRRKWEVNIKIDIKETVWGGMVCVHSCGSE